jgi:hypothetical protein
MWECLAGAPPFRRSSEFATLYAHLHDPLPRLRALRPELPAAIEGVLARGLAKSPLDRYGSCGELVAAARAAARPVRIDPRRLGLAAGIAGAIAAVGLALGFGVGSALNGEEAAPVTTTVVTTVAGTAYDAHDLDAAAFALLRDGHYARALPFARAAASALEGTGPTDPYEGFANFNLGVILVNLGRCDEALPPLELARSLQPRSGSTREMLARARACARKP